MLGFFFKECKNETSSIVCKSQSDIDKFVKKHTITLATMRSYVDYDNVDPGVGPVNFLFEEVLSV